jgi:hypothetical protein
MLAHNRHNYAQRRLTLQQRCWAQLDASQRASAPAIVTSNLGEEQRQSERYANKLQTIANRLA